MLIAFKHRIFGSNFAYLFKHCSDSQPLAVVQIGDKALPSIISDGQGLLVKMLTTLELHWFRRKMATVSIKSTVKLLWVLICIH